MSGYVHILTVLIVEHLLLLICHGLQAHQDVDKEHVLDEI